MRIRTALALGAATSLASCSTGPGAEHRPELAENDAERAASIYTAALEEFLRDSPERMQTSARVLVVDHAVEGAGWDPLHSAEKRPIEPLVQESITQDVDRVASLAWVASSDGAQADRTRSEAVGGCWIVPDGDLVVTLDLIHRDDDAVDVSVSAWGEELAPDTCGFGWLRSYVVEHTAAGWTVTEETVPSGVT